MAGNNTVKIDLQVASQGMDPAVTKSQTIKDNLTAASGAMGKVGGTSGSRSAAAKAESQAYGTSRAVGGGTGAASRDFAKESQGLGGLVRLYATVAANTFAAAAAFKALSDAMNTANMVKGLDQLGAASGKNLGSLSKQLVNITDGALSLREAMQSVAQSSSAGLGGAQIVQMGEVAKKASQALGVSLPDAMSRLSRGVTKLEPELLDELGIFTKLDEATRKYALSIGKPVSALTDFEKRQAFANAVLEEGTKKFNSINIDANPYDKLLASLQNLAQTGLDFINKFLAPVAKLLSQSPMALAAVIALIGKTLVGQALPALGQYKKNLEDQAIAATASLQAAQKMRDEHRKYIDSVEASSVAIKDKNAATKAGIEIDRLQSAVKPKSKVASILANAPDVRAEQDSTEAIKKTTAELEKQQKVLQARQDTKYSVQRQVEIDQIKATTAALKERTKAAEEYNKIVNVPARAGGPSMFSQEAKQVRDLKSATSKSTSIGILQDVSKTIDSSSIMDAFKNLGRGISENSDKLTTFGKVMTLARGTGAILSAVISGIASALSTLNIAVGLTVGGLALMDLVFSKNGKSAEEASQAFEVVRDSLDNLGRTIDVIKKKNPLEQFSTESLVAKGTAVSDLANNLTKAFEKSAAEITEASWWDTLKDKFKSIWGGDTATRDAKNLAETIIKTLDAGGAETEAGKGIIGLLGGLPANVDQLTDRLKGTDKTLKDQLLPSIKKVGVELANLGSKSQELDEAFKQASKTFDTIVISGLPTDGLAKLGLELLALGDKMQSAFKNPIVLLKQLGDLSTDESKLKFFSPKLRSELIEYSQGLKDVANKTASVKLETEALNKQQAAVFNQRKARDAETLKQIEQLRNADTSRTLGGTSATKTAIAPPTARVAPAIVSAFTTGESDALMAVARGQFKVFEKNAEISAAKSIELAKKVQEEAYAKGAKYIEQSIAKGFAEGRALISGAYTDRLAGTEEGIKRRLELSKEENARAIVDLEAKKGLVDSQTELRKALDLNTIAVERSTEDRKPDSEAKTNKLAELDKAKLKITSPDQFNARFPQEAEKKQGKTPAELAALGFAAQISKLKASDKAAEIRAETELSTLRKQKNNEALKQENDRSSAVSERFNLQVKGLAYIDKETLELEQLAETSRVLRTQAQERSDLEGRIAELDKTINATRGKKGSKSDFDAATSAQARLKSELEDLSKTQLARLGVVGAAQLSQVRDNAKNEELYRIEAETRLKEITQKSDQAVLQRRQNSVELLKNLGVEGALELAKLENSLAVEQEQNRTRIVQEEIKKRRDIDLASKQQAVDAQPIGSANAGIAKQQLDDAKAYYDGLTAGERAVSEAKLVNINYNNTMKLQMAEQAVSMSNLKTVVDSLAAVFGTVGSAVGDLMQTMQKAADTEKNNLTARIALQEDYAKAQKLEDPQDRATAEAAALKNLNALDKKATKDKVAGDIAQINSAKKVFKEKSAGYKALDAVEKVMHLKRLYEDNKELISTLWTEGKKLFAKVTTAETGLAATEAAALGELGINTALATQSVAVSTPAIFSTFSALMGPFGWAAAAAVVAAIAAMGGGGGGAPAGPSSAELAKVSGTGMTYGSDGKLTTREGGVVGDPTAKAESITKSIDKLGEVFFGTLDSDSSNLIKYLKGIEENTKGLAKAMLEQAGFFTGGDVMNIKTGSGGNWFSGKTSTNIDKAGVFIEGTLDQLTTLTDNFSGAAARLYANVTESDSGWLGFIGGGDYSYSVTQDLGQEGRKAIEGIFKNWKQALLLTAKGLEGSSDRVREVMRNYGKITIDVVRGEMNASEYATAVMNELSVKLNQATLAAMPYIKEFTQIGEEYYEAATRLLKEGLVLNQGLKMLGKEAISGGEGIASAIHKIQVQRAFLDKFGGDLSSAEAAIQYYFDNFRTESERSAYYTGQLADGFKELGYSAVPTIEQYTQIVDGLDAQDEAQAAMLGSLVKLAPAYEKVRQAQEKTAALRLDEQEASARSEEGIRAVVIARRELELKSMTDTDAAIKRRIYALQDEKSAYDKLKSALQDTVKGIKDSIKTLGDFQKSLLTGSASTLTPEQRLNAQRAEFSAAIAAAQGPRDTAEQRAAADTAAQNAARIGQDLIATGNTLYASGQASQELRDWVIEQSGTTMQVLQNAQTDTELLIKSVDESTNVLVSIDSSLTSTKDLWQTFINANMAAMEKPDKTIDPVSPGDQTTLSDVVVTLQTQIAVDKERNTILQNQLDAQAEQIRSNAAAMRAQTNELIAANKEIQDMRDYMARTQPVHPSEQT